MSIDYCIFFGKWIYWVWNVNEVLRWGSESVGIVYINVDVLFVGE